MILRHEMSHVPAITIERDKIDVHKRVNNSYWSIQFLFMGSLANRHWITFMDLRCSICFLIVETTSILPEPAYFKAIAKMAPVVTFT